MEKKILDVKLTKVTNDGDCLVKCVSEIYKWNKCPITTTHIVGMTGGLLLVDKGVSQGKVGYCQEWEWIDGMMLTKDSCIFESLEEGINRVKQEIRKENVVMISANTYYLAYTDDYLTNSGGFFNGGHMLLLHGFDEERKVFVVSDPVFHVEGYEISYEEFILAWTYTKDAGSFIPLTAFTFSKNDNVDHMPLMKESLHKSIFSYFDKGVPIVGQHSWEQVFCINKLINQLDSYMGKVFDAEKKDFIDNLYYSIFHHIRWARKSMGHFWALEEFAEYDGLKEHEEFFIHTFETWSVIANLLYIGLQEGKDARIERAKNKMIEVVGEETLHIEQVASILKLF